MCCHNAATLLFPSCLPYIQIKTQRGVLEQDSALNIITLASEQWAWQWAFGIYEHTIFLTSIPLYHPCQIFNTSIQHIRGLQNTTSGFLRPPKWYLSEWCPGQCTIQLPLAVPLHLMLLYQGRLLVHPEQNCLLCLAASLLEFHAQVRTFCMQNSCSTILPPSGIQIKRAKGLGLMKNP